MFRYELYPQDSGRTVQRWNVEWSRSSGGAAAEPVTLTSAHAVLLRQRAFKLERNLVPTMQTKFVLIILPWSSDEAIQYLQLQQQPSDVVCRVVDHHPQFLAEIRGVMEGIKVRLPEDTPFSLIEIISDTKNGSTLLVIDVSSPGHLLDVLDVCDTKLDSAASLLPFPVNSAANRRLVAFPCDPRQPDCIGPPVEEEYYAIPTCTLCCDRLDRTISGIVAAVCTCSDECCSCIFSSGCSACQASLVRDRPCSECMSDDDTWVCLMCGYLGCSRYRSRHVATHCQLHGHDFSLSLTTQQIWDYQSDRFVHRMILNVNNSAGTSERMQFPEPEVDDSHKANGGKEGFTRPHGSFPKSTTGKVLVDAKLDNKVEQCCANFSRELSSYLAAQRSHYIELLRQEEPSHSSSAPNCCNHAEPQPLVAVSAASVGSNEVKISRLFNELESDFASATNAAMRAHRSWTEFKERRCELDSVEAESSAALAEQALLKEQYRSQLMKDADNKAANDARIAELLQAIADVKLNLETQKRMTQKLSKGDGLSGTMAVLGNGRTSKRKH